MAFAKKLLRVEQDLILLAVRAALAAVLIAHGWQKLNDWGIDATESSFAEMGIPNAGPAAAFAIAAELGGGVLLAIGLLTPLVALVVVADMAGAFWYAHRGTDVFVADGGWELVAMIAAAALALVAFGAGRLSLDGLLLGMRRRRRTKKAALKRSPAPTVDSGISLLDDDADRDDTDGHDEVVVRDTTGVRDAESRDDRRDDLRDADATV